MADHAFPGRYIPLSECDVMGPRWKRHRVQLSRPSKWLSRERSSPSAHLSPSLYVVPPSRELFRILLGFLCSSSTHSWGEVGRSWESSFLAAVAVRSAASCRCTMIRINLFRLTLKYLLIRSLWWCVDFKWFPELRPVGRLQQSLEKKTFPLTSVEFSPFYIWSQSDLGLNDSP